MSRQEKYAQLIKEKGVYMKNIGVFFGSRSTEHDISIITAELVMSGLRGLNYNLTPVYITREGNWMIDESLANLETFTKSTNEIEGSDQFKKYYIDLENSNGKMIFKKKGSFGRSIEIDLAFPAFHGAYGEDGTIQGIFEMCNIPYVGSGVSASAVSMDKSLVKQICVANNLPTTKFISLFNNDWDKDRHALKKLVTNLKWPLFVKPVHLGSSIGISMVKKDDYDDLMDKIEVAFYYDDKVIIEESVINLMDVTCCVLGNDDLTASLLQESIFQTDLFSFEEKYLKGGGSQLGKHEGGVVIPARLTESEAENIQKLAKLTYKIIGCAGIARIDFLYNKKSKEVFVNEINPMPGTLYHHLWEKSGIDLSQLLGKLIKFAIDKHSLQNKCARTFKSSVLSNLKSTKLGVKNPKK